MERTAAARASAPGMGILSPGGDTADALKAADADENRSGGENGGQQKGGDALHLFMAEIMVGICLLFGEPDADHDDKRAENIRKRVHGIRNHGGTAGEDPGQKLDKGQDGIDDDSDNRDSIDFFTAFFRIHGHVLHFL